MAGLEDRQVAAAYMTRLERWLARCIELCTTVPTVEDLRAAELALNLAQRWPPVQQPLDLIQQGK